MSDTILDRIVRTKHEELTESQRSCSAEQIADLARQAPPPRGFRNALCGETVALIAEIKKASPTKGLIRPDFDPEAIAAGYTRGGAAALSVLTDATYFQGSLEILRQVRAAVTAPVLRKDFVIDPYQVLEARAAGADAVLLIVAILEEDQLGELFRAARELGMDALVEVHTRSEMEMALRLEANLVGINNRNLKTFETRLETTEELAAMAPPGVLVAALSGICTREDVERMARYGADAILVGESLMRQANVEAAARSLCGVPAVGRLGSV